MSSFFAFAVMAVCFRCTQRLVFVCECVLFSFGCNVNWIGRRCDMSFSLLYFDPI